MARYQNPLEVYGMTNILEEGVKSDDIKVNELLTLILKELIVMNRHLQMINNDEELEYDY